MDVLDTGKERINELEERFKEITPTWSEGPQKRTKHMTEWLKIRKT